MEYIMLTPIIRRTTRGVAETKPSQVYAIENVRDVKDFIGLRFNKIGLPPYFRVTGVNTDREPVLEQLSPRSSAYLKVEKWVGEGNNPNKNYHPRRILNQSTARCRISLDEVVKHFSNFTN